MKGSRILTSDYTNKFNTFLNRLSFRDQTPGSPSSESSAKVDDSIQSSREKIANLKTEKMNDANNNFIGEYLFDNENSPPAATTRMLGEEDDSLPPPELTTFAMGEEDDSLPPPSATTRMMGEEDDSLPPVYDNYINNYGHDNQRIKGSEGNDLIDSVGNNNNINSGKGNDLIYNDGNKNRINTGDGADQVFSNGKNNIIRTGSGDDNISLSSNSGGSKISAGQGDDNILVNEQSQGSISIKGGSGDDTVTIRGDEADYKLSIDARTGNRKYIHKTNGSEINIAKDVENIDFQRTRFEPQE
jgi:Ca2+-binding RTX toxin-like protein